MRAMSTWNDLDASATLTADKLPIPISKTVASNIVSSLEEQNLVLAKDSENDVSF